MIERTYLFYAKRLNISKLEAKSKGKKALEIALNFKNRKLSKIRNSELIYTEKYLRMDTKITDNCYFILQKKCISLLISLKQDAFLLIKKFTRC